MAERDGFFTSTARYPGFCVPRCNRVVKVHTRVVPLTRALNGEAVAQINKFLATAMLAKQWFLALGFFPSNPTLDWITKRTKDAYLAQNQGVRRESA